MIDLNISKNSSKCAQIASKKYLDAIFSFQIMYVKRQNKINIKPDATETPQQQNEKEQPKEAPEAQNKDPL